MLDKAVDKKRSDMLILKSEKETPLNIESGNPFISDDKVRIELGKKEQTKIFSQREFFHRSDIKDQNFSAPVETFANQVAKFPENPYSINNYGLSLMSQKRWREAIEQFEKATKLKKDFYSARMNLARCLKNLNRLDDAYSVYRELEKKRSTDTNVIMNIAHIYFIKGELNNANSRLDKILKIDEKNAAAYNNRAVIHMIEGRFDKAISDLRKAISNNIYFVGAINNLGVCYIALGSYRKALKYFYEALSIDSNYGDAVQNAAFSLHELQRNQEAINLLEDYLGKNKHDVSVRELLAKAYLITEKYDLSGRQLHIAIEVARKKYSKEEFDCESPRFYNNLGVIYHQKGNLEKANEFYLKAKKEERIKSEVLYRNIINLYFDMGRINAVRNELEESIKYFPESSRILFLYARYYFEIQDFEKADKLLKENIDKNPEYANSYAFLSFLYSEIYFNFDKAINVINKGLVYEKENHSLLNNLAYNFLLKNNVNKARAILDSIKDADDNIFLTATRGLLLLKEGHVKEGTSLYNRAISFAQHERSLGELVEQKKNLELAKFYHNKGRELETKKYLKRLLNSKLTDSIIYNQGVLLNNSLKQIEL